MKISIITAVFNGKSFLESAIGSVHSQTYPEIEYIIIDGGSTDGTVDIIRKHEGRIAKWVSGSDQGMYDALNKGIGMAAGDIIGFLHADDIYAHEKVLETVAVQMAKNRSDSCYGDLLYVDKDNTARTIRYWRAGDFSPDLLRKGWMPPHPTFFVRSEVYKKRGVFDTSFKIAADYELMLRFLGKYKISTHYIPEVLVKMRTGGQSNKNLSNIIRKTREDYRAMKMHDIDGPAALVRKNLLKLPQFLRRQ